MDLNGSWLSIQVRKYVHTSTIIPSFLAILNLKIFHKKSVKITTLMLLENVGKICQNYMLNITKNVKKKPVKITSIISRENRCKNCKDYTFIFTKKSQKYISILLAFQTFKPLIVHIVGKVSNFSRNEFFTNSCRILTDFMIYLFSFLVSKIPTKRLMAKKLQK